MTQTSTSLPSEGVPHDLARQRAGHISDVTYSLFLCVPEDVESRIQGHLTASFRTTGTDDVVFDFREADRLRKTRVNGVSIDADRGNGHVRIPRAYLSTGHNTVRFVFDASDGPLHRSRDLLYSLFVPARASRVFPCFDQPDLKARWRLLLDLPDEWTAVSNGAARRHRFHGSRCTTVFEETPPLPTYLFAIAAGRLEISEVHQRHRTFRVLHAKSDRSPTPAQSEAIASLHDRALDWLEDYTGVPHPFAKLDVVLIRDFPFSGMEHPGAIFYDARTLLLDGTASETQQLARAGVVAHETAHLWFGDLVTMTWFDDVWLKEVFASLIGSRIVDTWFPNIDHTLRFLLQHHPLAYDVDRTAGANPIRQTLDNLDDAPALYGPVVYRKSPVVMAQIERLLGPEAFRDGLRAYLSTRAFGNASWPNLLEIFQSRAVVDLDGRMSPWIDESGRSVVTVELESTNARTARLVVRQSDERGAQVTRPQRFTICAGIGSRVIRRFDIDLEHESEDCREAVGEAAPDWVLPESGQFYGAYRPDDRTLAFLAKALHSIDDPTLRGVGLLALWDAMLDGRLPTDKASTEIVTMLEGERNSLITQHLSSLARELLWRFTRPGRRLMLGEALEQIARARLGEATSPAEKGQWFRMLTAITVSAAGVEWLRQVWSRGVAVPGLTLSPRDEVDVAAELAVRAGGEWRSVLEIQHARLGDDADAARLAFLGPSLSADRLEREHFALGLQPRSDQAPEPWMIDAVRYVHHPLRAGESVRILQQTLSKLAHFRGSGDIFFAKRWVDATIGGYQSPEAADEVTAWLRTEPAASRTQLRSIVQTAADPLFRAARLLS